MTAKPRVPNKFVAVTLTLMIAFGTWASLAWALRIWLQHLSYGAAIVAVAAGALTIWTVSFLAEELRWRLVGKSIEIDGALWLFRENHFPTQRKSPGYGGYAPDQVIDIYLRDIQDDGRASPETRMAAARLGENIFMHEARGMSFGRRRRAALNAALNIHAPRENAPQ
jgi:hypothetical protein